MKPGIMRNVLLLILLILGVLTAACSGEDRSGEQPFAPTVQALSAEVMGDSCLLRGAVTASPNSSLRGVGFAYGNDTLRLTAVSDSCAALFQATTQPLQAGRYFAVAFAENGVGKTIGTDTIYFEIPAEE